MICREDQQVEEHGCCTYRQTCAVTIPDGWTCATEELPAAPNVSRIVFHAAHAQRPLLRIVFPERQTSAHESKLED